MPEFGEFIDRPYTTKEDRAAAAALPIAERQRIVKRLSAQTPQFKAAQKALKRFHMPLEGGTHDTGKICGLIGPSRVGKSWALANYIQSLGKMDRTDAVVPRAVYIEASKGGTGRDFAGNAYKLLGLGNPPARAAKWLLNEVGEEIVSYRIELVVIDDAQFVLGNTTRSTSDVMDGFLKWLSNKETCNIVLAGDQTVEDIIRSIDYLENRGGFPVEHVKPYAWSRDGQTGDFGKLLDRIDNRLPFLLPSNLSIPSTAAHLYKMSGGIIGKVMNIVGAAAIAAIGDGASNVGLDHLKQAAQTRWRVGDAYQPFEGTLWSQNPLITPDQDKPANEDEPKLTKRGRPRRAA